MTSLIGRTAFFAGIDPKLLQKVAESAIVRTYRQGEVIIGEGEIGPGMYVILRGRVEETRLRGGSRIVLSQLGPEQFFSETSLIDDKPRAATVTTLEETECLLFTRESFVQLMSRNPQLAISLARSLAERLRGVDEGNGNPSETPVSGNGAPAHAPSGKAAVQERLLGMFEWLYMAKAFTRFSVAMLGCPVEGTAANLVGEIRVGEIKMLVLPAGEAVEMRIDAYDSGSFGLHVFTPQNPASFRFEPVAIRAGDCFALSLPAMRLSRLSG